MLDDPGVDNHSSFYTELPTLHIYRESSSSFQAMAESQFKVGRFKSGRQHLHWIQFVLIT